MNFDDILYECDRIREARVVQARVKYLSELLHTKEMQFIIASALQRLVKGYTPTFNMLPNHRPLGALREYLGSLQTESDFLAMPYGVQKLIYYCSGLDKLRLAEDDVVPLLTTLPEPMLMISQAPQTTYLKTVERLPDGCPICGRFGRNQVCHECRAGLYEFTEFRVESFKIPLTKENFSGMIYPKQPKTMPKLLYRNWCLTLEDDCLTGGYLRSSISGPYQPCLPFIEYQLS